MIVSSLYKIYTFTRDSILAPPFCAHCKKYLEVRTIFCKNCQNMITPIVSKQIHINKNYTMSVFAVSDYKEPIKSLIMAKAWADTIASYQLGQLIVQKTYFKEMPCDYLIPIPLHWMRFAKRGYNQTEHMAHTLAKERGAVVAPIVTRLKRTPFQSSLSYDKRMQNVKEAFALNTQTPEQFYNKHIILVDDLMTTGSTLHAVAKVLIPLKPASIHAVVACRVL